MMAHPNFQEKTSPLDLLCLYQHSLPLSPAAVVIVDQMGFLEGKVFFTLAEVTQHGKDAGTATK